LLEGSPAFGKVPRSPASDEVIMTIRLFLCDDDEEMADSGEAWVVISLADPDCFYKMDEIIRNGLSSSVKWNFEQLG
jgi:hypothetical protein